MFDSTTACSMTDGGFGDSLEGVVEMTAEAVGVSTCVTEQLPVARWSIIFRVGSGRREFSIPFKAQKSSWVVWKIFGQYPSVLLAMAAYISDWSQILGSVFLTLLS